MLGTVRAHHREGRRPRERDGAWRVSLVRVSSPLLGAVVALQASVPLAHAQENGAREEETQRDEFEDDPEARAGAAAQSGLELALFGPTELRRGRASTYRGIAFRVRGLATLEPCGRASIRARFLTREHRGVVGEEVEVTARDDGRFELSVVGPEAREPLVLELTVRDDGSERSFEFPVHLRSALNVVARLDRRLYEPGEPVHAWVLVRDARSERPMAGERVTFTPRSAALGGGPRTATTGVDGVASATFQLPDDALEGPLALDVELDGELRVLGARIGERTYARLLADARLEPGLVTPGGSFVVEVRVTTPSGAPVPGAAVAVRVERGAEHSGVTDQDGVARVSATAPAYMDGDARSVPVVCEARHPALGSASAHAVLHLGVPLAASIHATSRLGAGLVPEIDDVVFLVTTDAAGHPLAEGTEIDVRGPAVVGGRATVRTDAAGIAEVPVRVPAGTWAPGSDESGRRTTRLVARIHGPLERSARLDVPVQTEAEVLPFVRTPLAAPGARIEVDIYRRASALRRTLVVELIDDASDILVVRRVPPGQTSLALDLPPDRVGLLSVRVRPERGDESAEGQGVFDRVLVVPARPGFVTVTTEQPRYLVGELARVAIEAGAAPPGVRAFAALMVRDLAAHDGEAPFRAFFLGRRFEQAVLSAGAATPTELRTVRLALAAQAHDEPPPARVPPLVDAMGLRVEEVFGGETRNDVLRDPHPLAREFERRGVAEAMRAAEQLLSEALDNGALDEVTTGRGPARRFVDDLLTDLGAETLGGAPLTVAHLEASDPSFRYEAVARRVARMRWVRLASALARYLDPGDGASVEARMAAREPYERWLPRLVERGFVEANALRDPWGGQFQLVRSSRASFPMSPLSRGVELVSPGPDGRIGTRDDFKDPFERVVPAGTPYAVASGEDALMRKLALLSAYERTVVALAEAYERIAAEMTEEEIGDVVRARVSEGALGELGGGGMSIGTVGHGGGSGFGYGQGAGAARVRAREPAVEAFRGLARVVRERFPATLLFRPSVELDAAGRAEIEVRLADAVTSYLAEVVMWRTDGWSWSGETRFEVDREVVLDAPVPAVVRLDDEIALPVRVGNRGPRRRTLLVSVLGAPELGVAPSAAVRLEADAGATVAVELPLRPTRLGRGTIGVAVATPDGEALDAVRLPLEVLPRARRVRRRVEAFGVRSVASSFEVPTGTSGRAAELVVRVGEDVLVPPQRGLIQRWAAGLGDPRPAVVRGDEDGDLALRLGALWSDSSMADGPFRRWIDDLARELDRSAGEPAAQRARRVGQWLLGLAPAVARSSDRPHVPNLAGWLERARTLVADTAAQIADDPALLSLAAAALAWTAPGEDADPLAVELARRVEPAVVTLGDDVFVAADDPVGASVSLALADARTGRTGRALALVRTLSRWTRHGLQLRDEERARLRVAAARLTGATGRASRVRVSVDGETREIEASSTARLSFPGLAEPGAHRVVVETDADALVSVEAVSTYSTPWPERPVRGPVDLRVEGEVGGLDETARLTLVVRNATPRALARTVVEVDLPTGAELTEASRTLVAGRCGCRPDRSGDVLTLALPLLLPGAERRIPLPLRWSVGGRLPGLGVVAWADGRDERASVLPPREVSVAAREEGGGR